MTAFDAASQTIFHAATPTGRGAVATLIIHGPSAMDCVSRLFRTRSGQRLNPKHFGRIVYGHWMMNDQPGEDLVVCPRDHTWLEIHCHGGESSAQLVAESLGQTGAIAVDSHAMATRISGNDYLANLTELISRAPTVRTAKYLLAQPRLHADFWTNLLPAIERRDSAAAIVLMQEFLAVKRFGKHLIEPWSVVFCGAPNVGKSSLINSILGFQRSIAHPIAGTTRDIVEAQTALNGWPVRLFDTAGIRDATDSIEQLGIDRAWQTIRSADLKILVMDSTAIDPNALQAQIEQTRPNLVIANKFDLVCSGIPLIEADIELQVSAITGMGIDRMIDQIGQLLVPQVPALSVPIPVTQNQIESVGRILHLVEEQNWIQARTESLSIYEMFCGTAI